MCPWLGMLNYGNEFSIRLSRIFEKSYSLENFYNSKQTAFFQGETFKEILYSPAN
jgi:hypothetical protein